MPDQEKYRQPTSREREITLKEIILQIQDSWKYLRSKYLIILITGIVGGIAGLVASYIKETTYIAQTTFVLEEDNTAGGMLGQLGGLAGLAGIEVGEGGGLFRGDNIMELYKSRTMIRKVLLSPMKSSPNGELLIDRYIAINELKDTWSDKPELKTIQFKDQSENRVRDSIISIVVRDINKNYLSVSKPDKNLSIIGVRVESPDEMFSKDFADNIVEKVNSFYVETKTKKSLQNVLILQHKTDSVRAVMNGAIFEAAAGVDATPNLNPTRQVLRAPVQRTQLNAEANRAVLTELVKNLELSKISLHRETPLIQVIDEPVLPLEKSKLRKSKGIALGGIIAGFLIVLVLLVKRVYKNIISE